MSGHDPENDDVQRRLAPRVVTSGHLLRLEQVSRDHQFSQNLDPQWLETVIPDGGHHVITPALTIPGRTHLPAEEDHLRSLVRIKLSDDLPWTDAPAMLSWLDLPFDVFEALPEPTTGVMNWIADLTTQGVPSMAQVAHQQALANERSVANAPATFPIWGTITWFTPEQGGRHGGPPLTPWETYYRATASVAPSRLEDGLASVIVDVSNRNLWQSNAKLRWLAEPHPAVGEGSCIFMTEGPKTVAILTVEHVDHEGPVHPTPLSEQALAEIAGRQRAATAGPWRSMIEGRDHTSGDSFIMTGTDDARGPDLYLTWDPLAGEDQRRLDQDFIAAAHQVVPELVAEIRRLRGLLDLLPDERQGRELQPDELDDSDAGGEVPPAGYVSPLTVFAVQTDPEVGPGSFAEGAFTSEADVVPACSGGLCRGSGRRRRLLLRAVGRRGIARRASVASGPQLYRRRSSTGQLPKLRRGSAA